MGRRFEIVSSGIDESLQGFSSDPYGSTPPTSFALRVPPALDVSVVPPSGQPRYEFCLATRVVQGKTTVRGIRQLLTIGISFSQEGPAIDYPVRCNVTTPFWRFIDGNVSWHLVKEPVAPEIGRFPPTDTANWMQGPYGRGPSMMYQTFKNTNVTSTGAPILYFQGLTAYTPPLVIASKRHPIANCGNLRTIAYPWNNPQAWDSLEETVEGNWRISLYASVLPSNPQTRPQANIPTITGSGYDLGQIVPEEVFIAAYPPPGEGPSPTSSPIYWDIGGAILFEDED